MRCCRLYSSLECSVRRRRTETERQVSKKGAPAREGEERRCGYKVGVRCGRNVVELRQGGRLNTSRKECCFCSRQQARPFYEARCYEAMTNLSRAACSSLGSCVCHLSVQLPLSLCCSRPPPDAAKMFHRLVLASTGPDVTRSRKPCHSHTMPKICTV